MQKIVFAGTPEIAKVCLQALITAGYDIQACLTQPDRPKGRGRELTASPVKELALQHNIPVYQPEKLSPKHDPETTNILQKLAPDMIIVVAYGMLIPKIILTIPRYGCINVHTSLLPKWRGAAPIQRALQAGDTETGVTIMQMDEGLDTGEIWEQYPCAITTDMTAGELYQKLANLGAEGLLQTLPKIWRGDIVSKPQQHELATYAHKINKQDGAINWQQSARDICLQVRAFNPWPVAYSSLNINSAVESKLNTIQVRIWRATVVTGAIPFELQTMNRANQDFALKGAGYLPEAIVAAPGTIVAAPGTIVAATSAGITVATGDGMVLLTEIQLPGKKAMPVSEVLKSQRELFTTKFCR